MATLPKQKRLLDAYRFAGFRALESVRGILGDPKARIVTLVRRSLQAREQSLTRLRRGLNNKIRVLQRRAYGLHDEEYLRLKILTSMLPKI